MSTAQVGALTVEFDEQVLEPRPWTVAQSRWAAEVAENLPPGPMLELCGGVGHIGLLTAQLTGRDAVLVDASRPACEFAAANARAAGLADRVEVRCGAVEDVLEPDERFPLLLVDPPYIPSAETGRFPTDPPMAIDGGPDGLDVARACLAVAAQHLDLGGVIILQLRDASQVWALDAGLFPAGLRTTEFRAVADHGVLARLEGVWE
jgi:methylase of polypeptide subunit release factors